VSAVAPAVLKNTMPETPFILFTMNTDLYADTVCAALGLTSSRRWMALRNCSNALMRCCPERGRDPVVGLSG